jgi:hypothetical protein
MGLAVGFPCVHDFGRPPHRRKTPAPHPRIRTAASNPGGTPPRRHRQARWATHVASLFRDASLGSRLRHPDCSRATGAPRRENNDDFTPMSSIAAGVACRARPTSYSAPAARPIASGSRFVSLRARNRRMEPELLGNKRQSRSIQAPQPHPYQAAGARLATCLRESNCSSAEADLRLGFNEFDESRNRNQLRMRVVNAADRALWEQGYVSPIDVLMGIG